MNFLFLKPFLVVVKKMERHFVNLKMATKVLVSHANLLQQNKCAKRDFLKVQRQEMIASKDAL